MKRIGHAWWTLSAIAVAVTFVLVPESAAATPTSSPVAVQTLSGTRSPLDWAATELRQAESMLARARAERGAERSGSLSRVAELVLDAQRRTLMTQSALGGQGKASAHVRRLGEVLSALRSQLDAAEAATAQAPAQLSSSSAPSATGLVSPSASCGPPGTYQPTDAEKQTVADAIQHELALNVDLSHAKPATPGTPTGGPAFALSVLLPPPCFAPSVPVGAPASLALAKVPADLMARAHSNTFVTTAGMSPVQLNILRAQIAHDNYQTAASSSSATTVMGGPGYSWYFGQIYGQYTSDHNIRLIGCNIELYGDTPEPTRHIQYGIDMSCSDAKMWWGQLVDLGLFIGTSSPIIQTGTNQYFSGNTGNHWGPVYDYRRYSESELEQIWGALGVEITGVKGADGWYGPPPTTGESVTCADDKYHANGEIGALSIACAIGSKPFTTIGGGTQYASYAENTALQAAAALESEAAALAGQALADVTGLVATLQQESACIQSQATSSGTTPTNDAICQQVGKVMQTNAVGPPGKLIEVFGPSTAASTNASTNGVALPDITCNGRVGYPHLSGTISGEIVVKTTVRCVGGPAAGGFVDVELWRDDESTSGTLTHFFVTSGAKFLGPFTKTFVPAATSCADGLYQGFGSMQLTAPPGYKPLFISRSAWGKPIQIKCP